MATQILEIREILSRNVKEQRKRLGLTLEKLAELTGLAVQTINDIEGGRRWLSDKTITKLSAALNIESYQLLIADFFSQNKGNENLTQQLLELKKNIQKNIDSQIEAQFNTLFKSGVLYPDIDTNNIIKTSPKNKQGKKKPPEKQD